MSVQFRDVVKRYGTATAVAGVSFTVEAGTLVTLLGPSGCGKTTTLRMIAGLELPSEGRILIAGRDVTNLSATQRDVSMVFQSYALFPHMSVLENVCYGLRRQMREEIRELQQRLGLTVVYVTHDQQEAMAVSDRIIVMNAGRIEQQGGPRDLYERPATPFLARFMGESNPARGRVRRLAPGKVSVRLGEAEIEIADTGAVDGEAMVAVRPEAITVELAPGPAGALSGKIAKASYLGTHMEYSIDTVAGTLFATCPRVERPLGAGTAVAVTLAPRGVIIVGQ